jgi:hypothetical protein
MEGLMKVRSSLLQFLKGVFKSRSSFEGVEGSYSIFEKGTDSFPLSGRPVLKSIEQLGADVQSCFYIQEGGCPVYDQFGRQKNLKIVPNKYASHIASLKLRAIYDFDSDPARRKEAGGMLGYFEPRILFHEWRKFKRG